MSSTLGRSLPPPARILVAEDTGIHSELARHMLQHEGYVVDVVADGRAAVQAFSRKHYDLVLLDCRMPGMDGFAAVKWMRRMERDAPIPTPIVAVTVYLDDASHIRCMRSGMTACLRKPLNLNELGRALETTTRRTSAA